MSPDEGRPRYRWPFVAFASAAVIVLALGIITLVSIGALIIPIGLAMVAGVVLWGRWGAVFGALAAGVAFSAALFLTAPLGCETGVEAGLGGEPVVTESCRRVLLPDLARSAQPPDFLLALGIATVAATLVGALAGRAGTRAPAGRARV